MNKKQLQNEFIPKRKTYFMGQIMSVLEMYLYASSVSICVGVILLIFESRNRVVNNKHTYFK